MTLITKKMHKINNQQDVGSVYLSQTYKEKFYRLYIECLSQGFTSNEARDYAELTLTGKNFHKKN